MAAKYVVRRPVAVEATYPNIIPVLVIGGWASWRRDRGGNLPSAVLGAATFSPVKLEPDV